MKRIFSGIQPTGGVTLGNYLGAIRNWAALQEEDYECIYCMVDLHAVTMWQDPATLADSTREVGAALIASGIDPKESIVFNQSKVAAHSQLAWIFNCVARVGWMNRMTQFKDKAGKNRENASLGLYAYPALMAADILIYDSSIVPVGVDQVQHLEFAQDMAGHFNQTYGDGQELLRRPEIRLSSTPKVPGTDGEKMSTSYGNTIPLFETGKKLKKLLGKIVTDSTALGEPLDSEDCNVFALLKLFSDDDELERIASYYRAGERDGEPFGYGHAKMLLADAIESHFAPAREKMAHFEAHPEEVEAVLVNGAARARPVARATLDRCKKACGLL